MNRKAFQSEAYCFITVGCTNCFTSTGTWSFMLLQLSWIRYYLKIKATSVASTVVFPRLISLTMWVPWTPRERRLGSCSLLSMATPGSFPCSTKWLQRLQGTMWDIGAEESSHLHQICTDCSVNCSPPGIQLRRAQAAAAKPCLSCFLLWHSLLCTSRRVFGRLFCGVWLTRKACSQRTLDTKYLLCWHLYYKLLAPVKQNPIKTFWPSYSKLPFLKQNQELTFQFLLLSTEKLVCSYLLWDWAELHRQENRHLGSWNRAKQSWTCILDCKEGNNITRKMDLPYKWYYNILLKNVYLKSNQMQDTLSKNSTL